MTSPPAILDAGARRLFTSRFLLRARGEMERRRGGVAAHHHVERRGRGEVDGAGFGRAVRIRAAVVAGGAGRGALLDVEVGVAVAAGREHVAAGGELRRGPALLFAARDGAAVVDTGPR